MKVAAILIPAPMLAAVPLPVGVWLRSCESGAMKEKKLLATLLAERNAFVPIAASHEPCCPVA
jgi:hypothetical protein